MRVIETSSDRDALAGLLGELHQLLDCNGWAPVAEFQTDRYGDSIQIKVQFSDNALAEGPADLSRFSRRIAQWLVKAILAADNTTTVAQAANPQSAFSLMIVTRFEWASS